MTNLLLCLFSFILSMLLVFSGACGSRHSAADKEMDLAESLMNTAPDSALAILDGIDGKNLSEADRNHHDLLMIKAADKAYVTHTSDSLILSVIDYYSRHSSDKSYPEALYYGGRVYSDLGDLPTAIQYYHTALDILPPETDNKSLRAKVLSQTADLLSYLRLNDKAISYIKDAIKTDSIIGDSINLLYDINSLGAIYLHNHKYNLAESTFMVAKQLAMHIANPEAATQDMYLAAVNYEEGLIDSALCHIRPALENINPHYRHTAIAYACQIYNSCHIPDTALMYARELIKDIGFPNRRIGYKILLSPEMKMYIQSDSIIKYAYDFHNETESHLNKSNDREVIVQESAYNYQTHLREKEKAFTENALLYKWIIIILIVVFILASYIFWLRYKNKSHLLELHKTKDNLRELRLELDKSKEETAKKKNKTVGMTKIKSDEERLRMEMRNELMEIQRNNTSPSTLAIEMVESNAYRRIRECIDKGKILSETDAIWSELEKEVIKSYPDFRHRLNILSGGSLKTQDLNLVLLIKCGFAPSELAVLVGRTKATISYRRKALGLKILGQDLSPDSIDNIIRLL